MKKIRQVPTQKQRITFKQIAVASSLGLASLVVAFTVFNGSMLQSDTAKANANAKKSAAAFIENGDEFYFQDFPEYEQAIPHYEQAIKTEPANAELNLKLGVCYLNSHDKFKAHDYLSRASTLLPTVDPLIHFYLGRSHQFHSDFDKAIAEYSLHLNSKSAPLKPETEKMIKECKNGKAIFKNPVKVEIENLGAAVNSMYPDYAPYISADENLLFFTSRRSDTQGGKMDAYDDFFFEDIYSIEKHGSVWQSAKNEGLPLNSNSHDALAGASADCKTLFVFKGNMNEGDILISKRENKTWTKPESAGKNINSKYHESTACLSSDGSMLYFVSDKPGGYGGRDIYKSKWDNTKKEWAKAENLGEAINTADDEEGIFMHPDGNTLYFSSKGHTTMGGYDIFSSLLEDGSWNEPKNLGSPINTPDDDVFFTVSKNGNAYYTSIRKEGFGDKDIYRITFPKTGSGIVAKATGTGGAASTK